MKFAIGLALRSHFARIALAFAAVLGSASASQAGFSVRVTQNNGAFTTFTDDDNDGTITFSGPIATAMDFDLSGFAVTSNSIDGSGLAAILTSSGTIGYTGSATGNTLTIELSDDTFQFPAPSTYELRSSSSYTEALTGAPDTFEFQSFATAGANLFGTSVPSPGTSYDLFESGSGSNNESYVAFNSGLPFTLTQRIEYFATVSGSVFNPTGSTIVVGTSAVPEPGSMALLGIGAAGLAGVVRRRRTKA